MKPTQPTIYGLMHLAAALFHAWVRRDGVFQSVARGTPRVSATEEAPNEEMVVYI